jgi:hypothetical protein
MPDPNELTPQNAPRDAAALAEKSPFQLRLLAERHLGSLRSEAEKQAWYGLKTTDARVNYILDLLKRWDQQNPGAATPSNGVSATATPAPVFERAPVVNTQAGPPTVQNMQPVPPMAGVPVAGATPTQFAPPTVSMGPNGMASVGVGGGGGPGFIPNVSQAAIAAAGAIAAGEKPKGRTPRTTAGTGAPADLGADVVNLLQRLLDGQEKDRERYDVMQKNVASILEDAASMKSSRINELEAQYTALTTAMSTLTNLVESAWKVQIWTMMMLLQAQANEHGVSPIDVLRSAMEDANNFQSIVNQAMGKV